MTFIFLKKNSLWQSHMVHYVQCIKAGNYEMGDSVQENYLSGSDREAIYHNDLSENDLLATRIRYLAKVIDVIKDHDLSENDLLDYPKGLAICQRIGFLAKVIDFIKENDLSENDFSENDLPDYPKELKKRKYLIKIIYFIVNDNDLMMCDDGLLEYRIDNLVDFLDQARCTVDFKISEAFSAFMTEIMDAENTFNGMLMARPKDQVYFLIKLLKKLLEEEFFNISKKIEESTELSALEKESLLALKDNIIYFYRLGA